jgi:class 3 adenylate cyclase
VAELLCKSLSSPDETIELPGVREELVELGDLTVGRQVVEPGWRWSTHVRPRVGGDWCQVRHVGVVISGRFGATLRDGTAREFGADDVYVVPPGHDGYTIGHEPCVLIEWSGLRAFSSVRGSQARALATLMFTDLADSTALASRLGDVAWRELLSTHFEAARAEIDRFGGREVNTTGDGMLATFDGPALALRSAAAIRQRAAAQDLKVRAGVHVGEVEIVGDDVRGTAVNAAARIMDQAEGDEILLSETTRTLALSAGLAFEERGVRELKGLPGEWRLFAHVPEADPAPT